MRCEDCLPLIEEYFDGEVTEQTGEAIRAHLAACADCLEALDALSFEQELYARYDRGGLEVAPQLWARVSAEIARTPLAPDSRAQRRPFLSRARAYFSAPLATLSARPALASTLALLVVAAAAGTLWLSLKSRPDVPTTEMAQTAPVAPDAVRPTAPDSRALNQTPTAAAPLHVTERFASEQGGAEAAKVVNATRLEGGAEIDVAELLADSSATRANPNIVIIGTDEHERADSADDIFVETSAPALDAFTTDARLLDPDQKDLARHVERAQMLLRSIKNVRAGDAGTDIAYEKKLSRRLLAENSTLQLEAEFKGDKQTRQVLDQIQPFLLEIANMGEKPSTEEVRSIRERVRKNEIVAALEVY